MEEVEGIPFSAKNLESLSYFHFFLLLIFFIAVTHYCLLESLWNFFDEGYNQSPDCQIQWILKSLSYLISASFDTTPPLAFLSPKFTFYVGVSQYSDFDFLSDYVHFLYSHIHPHNFSYHLFSHSFILSLFFPSSLCLCMCIHLTRAPFSSLSAC